MDGQIVFKFQSDSINTFGGRKRCNVADDFKFQSDSINTNAFFSLSFISASFKFQSDSINTCTLSGLLGVLRSSLNSNLILLIPNWREKFTAQWQL